MGTHHNPVLPGFHPDPSILAVGKGFYLVNSSFQYFPAIPIHYSEDLIHWTPVGFGVSDPDYLDLTELYDSRGIWAPDISFHDGWYYITATLRLNEYQPDGAPTKTLFRRQLIVKSRNPEGPYSRPWYVDVDGIDPSLFTDPADGKHYMLLNTQVTLIPLNDDFTGPASPPEVIWEGAGGRIPEGPHLLYKDGWYHCITAEGGTGKTHQVGHGRSRNLRGPYEKSPHSPILIQRDPASPLQRTGHGKLAQGPDGRWWFPYLCGRPVEGHCILGRETSVDEATWTDDGWLLINGGQGPTWNGPPAPGPVHTDEFDQVDLDLRWCFSRNPRPGSWSLTDRPGWLRLKGGVEPLTSFRASTLFLRRQEDFVFDAETRLDAGHLPADSEAGLVCWYDSKSWIKVAVVVGDALRGADAFPVIEKKLTNQRVVRLVVSENRGVGEQVLAVAALPLGEDGRLGVPWVDLKVTTDVFRRHFSFRVADGPWTEIGGTDDARYLSDEGSKENKRFTGSMVGLYHRGAGGWADFDRFEYRPRG